MYCLISNEEILHLDLLNYILQTIKFYIIPAIAHTLYNARQHSNTRYMFYKLLNNIRTSFREKIL